MVRAPRGASELAPSRSLAACQSVDVGGGQGFAAYPPVAALHLLDQAKSNLMIWRFCSLLNTSLMT